MSVTLAKGLPIVASLIRFLAVTTAGNIHSLLDESLIIRVRHRGISLDGCQHNSARYSLGR